MFEKIAAVLGEHPVLAQALAGAAGGVVRWLTLRDSLREGVASVVVGALSAMYLAPVAVRLTEKFAGVAITDDGGNLGAFLVGLFGMALTGFLIDLWKFAKKQTEEDAK